MHSRFQGRMEHDAASTCSAQERKGKAKVSFRVKVPHAKQDFTAEGFEGMSLRDVAEHGRGHGAELLREFIECACSGVMACSTCHVIVDPGWFEKVGHPSEAEQVCALQDRSEEN